MLNSRFEEQKKNVLSRKDNSKKGSIDDRVKRLVEKINSLENFYTTSSCAGRIIVYEKKSEKKFDTRWIYVSHTPAGLSELKKSMEKIPQSPTWLREEPMILHICGKTIENAQKILSIAREIGFKKSGIIATQKRFVVEITSTEIIDTIISDKGKMLVSWRYMKRLVAEANRKLKRNFSKIKKFEKEIENLK